MEFFPEGGACHASEDAGKTAKRQIKLKGRTMMHKACDGFPLGEPSDLPADPVCVPYGRGEEPQLGFLLISGICLAGAPKRARNGSPGAGMAVPIPQVVGRRVDLPRRMNISPSPYRAPHEGGVARALRRTISLTEWGASHHPEGSDYPKFWLVRYTAVKGEP